LLEKIKVDVIKFLLNIKIVVSETKDDKKVLRKETNKKVQRNEKCPCGSGKKFKCGNSRLN